MKLHKLRISGFQSFGPEATDILLDDLNFLIGPNGSGKTALLQALCRLFAFDPSLRRIIKSDFHIPLHEKSDAIPDERSFWIEVEFAFLELNDESDVEFSTIAPNFAHMRLDTTDGIPRVRFRLDAALDIDGEIEGILNYVLDVDDNDEPLTKHIVPKQDRNNIHIHYLPARRDPSAHITYTANSLLGRVIRAGSWQTEQGKIKDLTDKINDELTGNNAVTSLGEQITNQWKKLHTGLFFTAPKVTFVNSDIEALLKHLSVSFSPGHGEELVDFTRLSDGQKSMLYLSLVLSVQAIGRDVLNGTNDSFDVEKLKPAVFTLMAMEEPENSLSPHYLGRVVQTLKELGTQIDAQALIATHAPSMLKRVEPESIRYLRLNKFRQTQVSTIVIPPKDNDAHKYVREAVQAFPELYFSRMVVLGEGASEEIIIPRLLNAKGIITDQSAISVVPLGGRHVNHFWRLLHDLSIPYITLLDLDLSRYQGGWGRIRYAVDQLIKFPPEACTLTIENKNNLPKWNDDLKPSTEEEHGKWLTYLESQSVFYSSPMDIDFAMLKEFQTAYDLDMDDLEIPEINKIKMVLGDNYHNVELYTEDEKKLFITYYKCFKSSSKPSAHLKALANLSDEKLGTDMPTSLSRLVDSVIEKLENLPE